MKRLLKEWWCLIVILTLCELSVFIQKYQLLFSISSFFVLFAYGTIQVIKEMKAINARIKNKIDIMNNPKLTPEYIAYIASTLTEEELAELISEYGDNEASEANYWASKDAR